MARPPLDPTVSLTDAPFGQEMTGMALLAGRAIKELAVRSHYLHLSDGLQLEAAIQQVLRQTEDAKEGPRAFAEKRPAVFRGR